MLCYLQRSANIALRPGVPAEKVFFHAKEYDIFANSACFQHCRKHLITQNSSANQTLESDWKLATSHWYFIQLRVSSRWKTFILDKVAFTADPKLAYEIFKLLSNILHNCKDYYIHWVGEANVIWLRHFPVLRKRWDSLR